LRGDNFAIGGDFRTAVTDGSEGSALRPKMQPNKAGREASPLGWATPALRSTFFYRAILLFAGVTVMVTGSEVIVPQRFSARTT
jgi:hypothetical protein